MGVIVRVGHHIEIAIKPLIQCPIISLTYKFQVVGPMELPIFFSFYNTRPLLRLYETPVYFADPVGSYRRPTRIRLYNLNGRRHPEQLEFYNNRGKNLSTSLAQIR